MKTPHKKRFRIFLNENQRNCKFQWYDLRFLVPGMENYGEKSINSAMKSMGFNRKIRRRVIKFTQWHCNLRVDWAREMKRRYLTKESWLQLTILWSDEMWVINNLMWQNWIIIYDIEDPAMWEILRQKGYGWMFWASFMNFI